MMCDRSSADKKIGERKTAKVGSDVTYVGLNSHEFIKATMATAADVLSGRISPSEARARNAEHRKILKIFEELAKFGRRIERMKL
jgi:hypothetical protein